MKRWLLVVGVAVIAVSGGLVGAEELGKDATGADTAAAETAPPAPKPAAIRWGIDKAPAKHRVRPQLPGWPAAGILIDLNTGQVMWSYRADTRRPIASLTKMMNALIVTRRPILDKTIQISSNAANMGLSLIHI